MGDGGIPLELHHLLSPGFLLAFSSVKSGHFVQLGERYSITQRPQNLPWTYLHCRRLDISDALVSSMDAQFLCFPTRICGSSLGKCVTYASGRLSSDCVRSLCCCYLDLLQLYAVCQLYTSTSKRPHEAMGPLGSDQKLSGNGVGQIFFTGQRGHDFFGPSAQWGHDFFGPSAQWGHDFF